MLRARCMRLRRKRVKFAEVATKKLSAVFHRATYEPVRAIVVTKKIANEKALVSTRVEQTSRRRLRNSVLAEDNTEKITSLVALLEK